MKSTIAIVDSIFIISQALLDLLQRPDFFRRTLLYHFSLAVLGNSKG